MPVIEKEKLSRKKLLSFTPTLGDRLDRVASMRGEDATEIIRRGVITELDRIEALRPPLDAITAARLEKLRALSELHVDVENMLDAALIRAGDAQFKRSA